MSELKNELKTELYKQVELLEREIEVNENKIFFYEERLAKLEEINRQNMNEIRGIMRRVRAMRELENCEGLDCE